jgi:hypothetical protein
MHDRQGELEALLREPYTEPVLDAIQQIVEEQCDEGTHLFSGFIGVFAEAMVLLGQHGRIVVYNDNGGRVVEAHRR